MGRLRGRRPEARSGIEYAYIHIYSYLSLSYFISAYIYFEFYCFVKGFSID